MLYTGEVYFYFKLNNKIEDDYFQELGREKNNQ